MVKYNYSVENVYKNGLCCGCGTCAGICPQNCIKIDLNREKNQLRPYVNYNKCIHCNMCLRVCPGIGVDFKLLNTNVDNIDNSIWIGKSTLTSLVWSKNKNLRKKAASGAAVSEIASIAIEYGIIDGIILSRLKSGYPLRADSYIARSRIEIEASCGSIYLPISVNEILKEIKNAKGRYGIIGLPCHIEGVKKAILHFPVLKEKIVLLLGLFCVKTPTFHATEYYIKQKKIIYENIKNIKFRGKGWPGKIQIELINGEKKEFYRRNKIRNFKALVAQSASYNLHFFESSRCRLCIDETNELADISFGDPWLSSILSTESIGKTLCIVRSQIGENIYNIALEKGYLSQENISIPEVIESQNPSLFNKKNFKPKAYIAIKFNYSVPLYPKTNYFSNSRFSIYQYLSSLIDYLEILIGKNQTLWFVINYYTAMKVIFRGVIRILFKNKKK